MDENHHSELTDLLHRVQENEPGAENQLFEKLQGEVQISAQSLMRQELSEHTLQPTALFNEAVLKVLSSDLLQTASNRRHLISATIRAMKQVLVDHARKRNASKRIPPNKRKPLDAFLDTMRTRDGIDMENLSEALEALEAESPRQAEVIQYQFFAGMQTQEIADALGVSTATVKRDLVFAKAMLAEKLVDHSQE